MIINAYATLAFEDTMDHVVNCKNLFIRGGEVLAGKYREVEDVDPIFTHKLTFNLLGGHTDDDYWYPCEVDERPIFVSLTFYLDGTPVEDKYYSRFQLKLDGKSDNPGCNGESLLYKPTVFVTFLSGDRSSTTYNWLSFRVLLYNNKKKRKKVFWCVMLFVQC